jgi:putative hydrolase of the HAD superfamily
MGSGFRAVLFDLFDTLCHLDEAVYREGKRHAAGLLGLDPDRYFDAWIGLQDRCQRGEIPDARERIRTICAALGRDCFPEILERVDRYERELLLRCAALHEDALPALERIRSVDTLRVGLVSNASSPARWILRRLRLEPYFDTVVFSFEVGVLKPEPGIYREACRRLEVSPGDCLFVGDGNARELEGALDLGMTAVRIERPLAMEPFRRDPSRRWSCSLADLRDLVEVLAAGPGAGAPSER